tara:strand:- start:932 stop:2068 length:1137 start_codon:yes stop_codon:yes gene_type:complete
MKTNNIIIHISHTDIRYDSRILKQLKSLSLLKGFYILGIGINSTEKNKDKIEDGYLIENIKLKTKSALKINRSLLYTINFIEANFIFTAKLLFLKPRVIHCHDTFLLISAFIIKLIFGTVIIYDAHELESNKNGQSKILSIATLILEKLCWKKIDLLISVSGSILDWYCKNLGYKKNLLILNAPEINQFDAKINNPSLREKFNIPRNELLFLYCGLLSKGRFIEDTLEIFKQLNKKAHILFVGEGELLDLVNSYCSKYINIHQQNFVKHDNLVSIIKESDIGLCLIEKISLSDYYCLPNKLFEYLFANINILASNFPDIKQFSKKYKSITLCETNKESIKQKIDFLIKYKPKKYSQDLKEISWSNQSKNLKEAYKLFL